MTDRFKVCQPVQVYVRLVNRVYCIFELTFYCIIVSSEVFPLETGLSNKNDFKEIYLAYIEGS